jgi:glucose-1-phosphate adenylyltransferase
MYPLTKLRSAPAVTVAGKYRLIDIPISNCINSGLQRIYVLTQFLSVSLHRHIANTYKFAPFSQSFVEVLAAQQTNEAADWYQGTADALRQNLRYLNADGARDVLILSGDGLYRMNYADMVQTHRDSGADITMAVVPVRRAQTSSLGVVRIDDDNRLVDLVEKPRTAEQLEMLRAPAEWLTKRGLNEPGKEYLANMGIYLCKRSVLLDLLRAQPEAVDLVTQHFARILRSHRIQAHLFTDYWQDLGSVRTYHEAHLALAADNPPFDFHDPHGVIYTRMRHLPAARVGAGSVEASLISDGCVIAAGCRLERCIVGLRTHIGPGVTLRDTVVNGTDRYESEEEKRQHRGRGAPPMGVGAGSIISRASHPRRHRRHPQGGGGPRRDGHLIGIGRSAGNCYSLSPAPPRRRYGSRRVQACGICSRSSRCCSPRARRWRCSAPVPSAASRSCSMGSRAAPRSGSPAAPTPPRACSSMS